MFSHEEIPCRISPGSPCGTMIPRGSPSILSPAIFQSCLCRNPAHSFCLSQVSSPPPRIDDAESSHPASLPPRGHSSPFPPLFVDHCDHWDHCDPAQEGGGHGNFTSNTPEVTRTVPVAPVAETGTRVKENVPLTLVAEMLRTVTVPDPPRPAPIAFHCFWVSVRESSTYCALVPLPSPTLRVATTAKKSNANPVSSQLLPAIEIAGLPAIVDETATRPEVGNVLPAVQGDPSMVALKTPLLRSSQAGNPPEPDPSAPLGLAGLPLPPPPPQAASMRNRASENA